MTYTQCRVTKTELKYIIVLSWNPQDMGLYNIAFFYNFDNISQTQGRLNGGKWPKTVYFGLFRHMKMPLIILFHKITESYCFLIKHIKVTSVSNILKDRDMEYSIFHDIIHQKCVFATCPVW